MLYIKFQGFLFLGSGDNLPRVFKDNLSTRVFKIYGQDGHLEELKVLY